MQPDILNIGAFKMFKQSFKNFKPEVLNATSLTRWNEVIPKVLRYLLAI